MRSRANRRVATALFIDVVDSTRIAADVGDRRWRELVASFRATVRRHLKRHAGHEVDTAGDGFFATFESPASALRAASAIVADVQGRGLDVRCGLHTGELERIDGRLGGIGAHIAARVMAEAGAAQVYATATVRDLVIGGAADFEPVGERVLKGVPGRWTLHRLTAVNGTTLPSPLNAVEATARRAADEATAKRGRVVAMGITATVVALAAVGIFLLTRQDAAGETPSAGASPSLLPVALVKLDPTTRELTAEVRDASLPPFGGEVQVVDGTLWLAMADQVTRRDLETGEVLGTIDIPSEWWAVKYGFGSVWVGHPKVPGRPKVYQFDAISGREKGQIDPGTIFWDFTIGDRSIYLIGEPAEVIEVDPASLEIVDRDPTGTQTQPHYIGYEDGHLWLVEGDRSAEFDPDTDSVVGGITRGQLGLGGGGTDPETGTIWMTDRGNGTITPVDPETGAADRPIGLAGVPRGFAFGFDALWLAAEEYVYRIDSWSKQHERIAMPPGVIATGVAIDEETGTIWISTCAVECADFVD
ncbi:MAG TPA: adenylate/guanylate cyclase domain-containing protein [Candidatus Limnocylindria bacterium]|nr:adenylate/guanylate cyclase domain-containing protein [Candidatus Limnocylindria bacterium]